LGECLIDFALVPGGETIDLKGNPGGAPANVLAAAAKLGHSTAFIGKVGQDFFGRTLKNCLDGCHIDTSNLIMARQPTTLAIVSIDGAGERSFSFYRDNTADVNLRYEDIDEELLKTARIFHFGSVSMTAEPARSATLQVAKTAKQAGAVISFDPNLRPMLWADLSEAREQIRKGLTLADLVKVNAEEAEFITEIKDPEQAGRKLMADYGLRLLAVTLDRDGSILFSQNAALRHSGYPARCVDSTGAGDAFWGAALSFLLENGLLMQDCSRDTLTDLSAFANGAGALTTQKPGAIPALPAREEIQKLIGRFSET